MPRPKSTFKQAQRAFNFRALKRICEMHENEFAEAYGMERVGVRPGDEDDFYLFKDNNSAILAVAHLDTVVAHSRRLCTMVRSAAGQVIHSGALDDRLGAYTILELLPSLGINYNWLLTTGEEMGQSTASYFDPGEIEYNWIIEFDRSGTDVVMYQYQDSASTDLVSQSGARVGHGSYSDISLMEHLELKAFNWGVGYQGDYHSVRGHFFLDDYVAMMGRYLRFHEANQDTWLPHVPRPTGIYSGYRPSGFGSNIWVDEEADRDYKLDVTLDDDDTAALPLVAPPEPKAIEARKDAEKDEAEYAAMNKAWR